MKKIIYSNYTKFIAVILFIISIVSGALIVTDGISDFYDEREIIYNFENDFSESRHLAQLLVAPESAIFNAYHNFYLVDDENETVDRERPLIVNGETIEQNIEKKLNALYCADKVNYYVKWNDTVFTNCGATNEKELMTAQFYLSTIRDDKGNTERESSQNTYYSYPLLDELSLYDKTTSIIVCTSIKNEYIAECKAKWDRQAAIVNDTFTEALFFAVLALLLLIYLICVCGKDKDGNHKSMWLDNIWAEVHLAAIGCCGLGSVMICAILLDSFSTGHFPQNLLNLSVGTAAGIASAVCITSLLSIIRNIKCKKFVASSIIARVVRWAFKTLVSILRWLRNGFINCRNILFKTLSKKTGVILIGMLFVYTTLMGMFGFLGYNNGFFVMLGVLLFLFAAFVVAYRAKDVDEIKKGAEEIRMGNLNYKVAEIKCEDLKKLAENINEIGDGLEKSVSAQVKAERLKTDLITNVSHDLKTPLTSIISYTELLLQVEALPEEARDYVAIIAKKSERLKNLTQDLFDVSKVQSGNDSVVFEKLDAALLVSQSLAEHDNEIKASELNFCIKTDKDLYFSADGRKMSRVIGNLIDNAVKYAMKGTRVFVSAFEKDNEVVIELKNTSAYPMDFDAEEITGRFVRGDESRTDGGNGLGLAIAKSYTEVCGGKFDIVLDGDLFKAVIRFTKA